MTAARAMLAACGVCAVLAPLGAPGSTVSWTEMPGWAPPLLGGFPTAADLNGDGRPDLIVSGPWHGPRNDGGCANPTWSPGDEWCAGLPNPVSPKPELCDLDEDGDADLLIGEWYGEIMFYRNVGTPQAPAWARDDAYFHDSWSRLRAPGGADLDGDGDLDIVSGSSSMVPLLVHWNDGTPALPAWREDQSYFAATPLIGNSIDPNFADLDGDGDLDLVAAPEAPSLMQAFENTGSGWELNEGLLTGVARPQSAIGVTLPDLNCDGRADLVVFGKFAGVWGTRCYRNEGPTSGVGQGWRWTTIKALFR